MLALHRSFDVSSDIATGGFRFAARLVLDEFDSPPPSEIVSRRWSAIKEVSSEKSLL